MALLATLSAVFFVVIVHLARSRAKALKELSLLRESGQRQQNVTYEEVNLTLSAIDTNENVAYGQLSNRR